MNKTFIENGKLSCCSYRCPRCGKVLDASNLAEYVYQCKDCDEDFYAFEAANITVTLTEPTAEEQQRYNEDGFRVDLSRMVKISVVDEQRHSGHCYMDKNDALRLGLEYITDHVRLEFSEVCEEYFVRISQNDYYNDLTRNPEKTIHVRFVGTEEGTGRQVYKGVDSGLYYLRAVSNREPFAKWLIGGKRRLPDDGNEPRANLIFVCGKESEKVTYDDWNGVCAYSDTFNKDFLSDV